MHTDTLKRASIVLTLLLAVSGCASTSTNTDDLDGRYLDSLSINALPASDNPSQREFPTHDLLALEQVEQELQLMLDELLSHWPGTIALPINVKVSAESLYMGKAGDDTILLSLGLIREARSNDELAFVLSHEAAHILMQHYANNGQFFKNQDQQMAFVSELAVFALQLEDVGLDNEQALSESAEKSTRRTLRSQQALAHANQNLFSSSLSRQQEDQADLIAIDLMSAAGYSPKAFQPVMHKLSLAYKENEARRQARQQQQQGFIEAMGANAADDNEFTEIAKLMAIDVGARILNGSAATHYPPEQRSAKLQRYIDKAYPAAAPIGSRNVVWQNPLSPFSLEAVGRYQLTQQSLLAEQRELAASTLALAQFQGESDNWYPNLVSAQFYQQQGESARAAASLAKITHWQGCSIQSYILASQLLRQQNQFDQAYALLKQAQTDIGNATPFYPELIVIHRERGDDVAMQQALDDCQQQLQDKANDCFLAAGLQATAAGGATPQPVANESSEDGLASGLESFENSVEEVGNKLKDLFSF
ncbi:M48 family metalloprotease [Aliagarivorans marinus]|uniref:M48 family metalloprotease n=1 Tax=Aliagarivorans marinus TaxID=561965 RepID=UPI00047AC8E6|nr:M48 family metalloprotease [Aliagarivorans marinus]